MPSQLTRKEADQILQDMLDRPPTIDSRPDLPGSDKAVEQDMFNNFLKRVNDGADYDQLNSQYERMRNRKHEIDRELYRLSQQPENQCRLSEALSNFLTRPVSDFSEGESISVGLWDLVDDVPNAVDHIGADSDPLRAGAHEYLRQYGVQNFAVRAGEKYNEIANAWYGTHEETLRSQGVYENKQELLDYCWEQEEQIGYMTLPPRDPPPGTMSWVPEGWAEDGYQPYTSETG